MISRSTLTLLAFTAAIVAMPAAAWAAEGFARTSASMRAGPGDDYPRIAMVSRGQSLEVYGCLESHAWCDVSTDGDRGWFPGSRIDFVHDGRRMILSDNYAMFGLGVLAFGIDDYWGDHYRNRPWVNDRRWRPNPVGLRSPQGSRTGTDAGRPHNGPGAGAAPAPKEPAVKPLAEPAPQSPSRGKSQPEQAAPRQMSTPKVNAPKQREARPPIAQPDRAPGRSAPSPAGGQKQDCPGPNGCR